MHSNIGVAYELYNILLTTFNRPLRMGHSHVVCAKLSQLELYLHDAMKPKP